MQDGVAYIYNLKRVLKENNMPLPEGVIVTDEMFDQIEHAFPALVVDRDYTGGFTSSLQAGRGTKAKLMGIVVIRGNK